jgi:hypothetical protein
LPHGGALGRQQAWRTHSVRLARRGGETNRYEISIPKGELLILKHDPNGLFAGLKGVPPAERPPLVPVFFAFAAPVKSRHEIPRDLDRVDQDGGRALRDARRFRPRHSRAVFVHAR